MRDLSLALMLGCQIVRQPIQSMIRLIAETVYRQRVIFYDNNALIALCGPFERLTITPDRTAPISSITTFAFRSDASWSACVDDDFHDHLYWIRKINYIALQRFKLNASLKAIMRRRTRSPVTETAIRSAILATPMVLAMLAVYAAYGSESRVSVAIDQTITGSISRHHK